MKKNELRRKRARYTGLSEEFVEDYNLEVPAAAFWKELLRGEGNTIGRLDSRYKGVNRTDGGERYDYPAEYSLWKRSFTPAINHYLQDVLGFKTDFFSAKYTMWNIDPSGKLKDRFRFEEYRSGHMMYLRTEVLKFQMNI